MKKIKFAIIGCGRISYRHIEAIESNPHAELVALCDLDLARAKERNTPPNVKIYQNYNEMLLKEDVDVVNIMTPSGMHTEHAIDIINKFKKHLVIEKPMCLDIKLGKELIEKAKTNNVELFIVHQNRFNKAVQKIRSAVNDHSLGKLSLATVRLRWARTQNYYNRDPWRGTWGLDGGALTNQAIHHIDILRWIIGDVESLSAVGKTQFVNVETEDTACCWLRFKNGALGAIEATTTVRPDRQDIEASFSLLTEHGTIIIEGSAVNKITTWTIGDIDKEKYTENPPNVYGFGHNIIIDNVVKTLNGQEKPLVSGEEALKSLELLSAIYKSIELGGKEVLLQDNPTSGKLGIFNEKTTKIADLYRTDVALTKTPC
ncbi:Gfo/Idh/MocA family protein [Candidatus Margulisiibacteriota bacterium]